MPSTCSFIDVACQTSCALDDLHDAASSFDIICTSCFDLIVEVMALEILCDEGALAYDGKKIRVLNRELLEKRSKG